MSVKKKINRSVLPGIELTRRQFTRQVIAELGRGLVPSEGAERDRRCEGRDSVPESAVAEFVAWCRAQEKIGVVRRLRELRGRLSQKAFAASLGMKPQQLNRYERGRVPDLEILLKIAATTGTNLNWLLTGGDERRSSEAAAHESVPEPDSKERGALEEDQALISLLNMVRQIYSSGDPEILLALRQNLQVFLRFIRREKMRQPRVWRRLGDILVGWGLVTPKQINHALNEQEERGVGTRVEEDSI